MFFSEKYPQIMASIEEKLQKQVEERGLDFETVRKDVEDGLKYELEYYGIAGFGSSYALMRTPGPLFFEYKDVFWACGREAETNGGETIDCVLVVFNDGEELVVKIRDRSDENDILYRIKNANKKALIGYTKENQSLYEEHKKRLGIVDEPPKKTTAPEPEAKLPEERITSAMSKFKHIMELSDKLKALDGKWYVKTNAPLTKEEIRKWTWENYAHIPEEYINILLLTNGFCVDYDSTVGYFNLDPFSTDEDADSLYNRSREEMKERKYSSYENCKPSFGWLNHRMLHYNPYTAEMFIEKERYKYEKIENFEKEILDEAIRYLETKLKRFEQKEDLLKAASANPFKEMYDKLLVYKEEKDEDFTHIYIHEPLGKEEIAAWEKEHQIRLPEDYKNWLQLSNGASFGNKEIYPLELVNTKELAIGPDDEKGYIVIADLSGYSDILVFDPETAELYVLDDDGGISEGDFEIDIFEDGFDFLEDE
ncbi:MAG: SMI1/KNR4 family protein [Lachnospiraceae bacterium]|nr:SMI1/KNR4 family protein [Lachnospiraceae bacterium]